MENITGFSKTKRDLAIKLGVDPYSTNEVFQKELNKVAWPAFLGKFSVNLGMAAVGGAALSAANWTSTLTDALRDKSPAELRLMNLGLLTNNMGVSRATADAFLNNNAISPTTQTILVAALAQLGNIPGQAEFIRQAATSQDEHDATRLPAERPVDGQPEQQYADCAHQSSQRTHHLPNQRWNSGRPNPMGLRSLDADDRAFHHRTQGLEIHQPGFQLFRNSHRRRLTHDRPGPRRAWREGHDQSAPRPAAMKQPVHDRSALA